MGLEQSENISEAYTHQNICQKHLRESRGSKQSFKEAVSLCLPIRWQILVSSWPCIKVVFFSYIGQAMSPCRRHGFTACRGLCPLDPLCRPCRASKLEHNLYIGLPIHTVTFQSVQTSQVTDSLSVQNISSVTGHNGPVQIGFRCHRAVLGSIASILVNYWYSFWQVSKILLWVTGHRMTVQIVPVGQGPSELIRKLQY